MPLFEIGYRRYEGKRTSHLTRWLPITRSGLAVASVDEFGNRSQLSESFQFRTSPTEDFWEHYRSSGDFGRALPVAGTSGLPPPAIHL